MGELQFYSILDVSQIASGEPCPETTGATRQLSPRDSFDSLIVYSIQQETSQSVYACLAESAIVFFALSIIYVPPQVETPSPSASTSAPFVSVVRRMSSFKMFLTLPLLPLFFADNITTFWRQFECDYPTNHSSECSADYTFTEHVHHRYANHSSKRCDARDTVCVPRGY